MSKIWLPDGTSTEDRCMWEITDSYGNYLQHCYLGHHEKYQRLLQNDLEAARAEAIVFSFLYAKFRTAIREDVSDGGVDFYCKTEDGAYEFVVEVTHISKEALTKSANFSYDSEGQVSSYSWVPELVYWRVKAKADQMSGAACPRALVITSEHEAAVNLFRPEVANEMMVPTEIRIPLDKPNADGELTMKHLAAPFFSVEPGSKLMARRQSVSMVLLVAIVPGQLFVTGLLHPEPVIPFDATYFPNVPFCRIINWPCSNGGIKRDWGMPGPTAARYEYHPIDFTRCRK